MVDSKASAELHIKIYNSLKKNSDSTNTVEDIKLTMVSAKKALEQSLKYFNSKHSSSNVLTPLANAGVLPLKTSRDALLVLNQPMGLYNDDYVISPSDASNIHALYVKLLDVTSIKTAKHYIDASTIIILYKNLDDDSNTDLINHAKTLLSNIGVTSKVDTSDVRTSVMSHVNENKDTIYTVEISVPNKFQSKSTTNTYVGSDYAISARIEKIRSIYNFDDVITSTSSKYSSETGDITYTVEVSVPKKWRAEYSTVGIKRPDAFDTLAHILTHK